MPRKPGLAREWGLLETAPHLARGERVLVVAPSLPSLLLLLLASK